MMQHVDEIQRIEIKKLYNTIDVSFDLTRDCTILIGENGIGKTTALKILQYLLEGNFVLLASITFDN